jgi:hypothetical protein
MGSVTSYIDCPHCSKEAWNDFNYKTGEEYTICDNCGYTNELSIVRDEEGAWVMDEDGTTPQTQFKELKNPYGCIKIATGQGVGQLYSVPDEGEFRELCKTLNNFVVEDAKKPDDGNKILYITISRFENGNINNDTLYDGYTKYNRLTENFPDPMTPEDVIPTTVEQAQHMLDNPENYGLI